MKKKISLLIVAILLSMASVEAQTWNFGAQGDNVIATLSNDTLFVSGSGDMANVNGDTLWNFWDITTVIIDSGVTSIGNYAFYDYSSLTSVTIPNSIINIGLGAFALCGLTSITIPNSVMSIGQLAFADCDMLSSVTIGNSVTNIGDYAFYHCNLASIITHAITPPILGTSVFHDIYTTPNFPVYIPCFTYDNYRNAYRWNYFTNFVINGSSTASYNEVKCYGVPYTDQNFTTPIYDAGTYYATLTNSTNCDSIVCLTLTEYPFVPITDYFATFCQGGSYTDNHFTNLTEAGTYYDTLKNVNNCDSIVCLILSYPIFPMQELCMITVDENNHNEIVWKELDEVVSYNIYREGTQGGQYDLIANIDYSKPNSWTDTTSNAKTRSYRYKISAIDTCGNESERSDAHKTMHLTINAGVNNSWNLIWAEYEGTEYATYNIYRADSTNTFTLIDSISIGYTSYSDFTALSGYVYYMIEILMNEPCVLTKSLSSIRSNIASNNPNVGIVGANGIRPEIRVYPNPAGNQLTIECKDAACHVPTVEIYSVVGQKLMQLPCRDVINHVSTIDISHLANGMYYLKIDNKTVKFVKE